MMPTRKGVEGDEDEGEVGGEGVGEDGEDGGEEEAGGGVVFVGTSTSC